MIQKIGLLILAAILPAILLLPAGTIHAQDSIQARTTAPLNMRSGPGQGYDVIAQLTPDTGLILEARSADGGWVIGHTISGLLRGWVASDFLTVPDGFSLSALPASDEIIAPPDTPDPLNRPVAYEAVDLNNGIDLMRARAASIDLTAYPILPETFGQAAIIYQRGLALGRDPRVVAKVGDCNTAGWVFLYPFGEGQYDLGDYAQLQGVIDQFGESFTHQAYAAHNGLNAGAVLDPTWAAPGVCEPGETPLACEYRTYDPAVAIIMFGTNDMVSLTADQFDYYLRRVIHETMDAGIIPVISTFPRHLSFPDRSILFNQIVVRIALDYDLPLINLWLALEPLPGHGIAPDGFHLDGPLTRAGDMSLPNLETGYPLRNLLTLQTLDRLWRTVMQ